MFGQSAVQPIQHRLDLAVGFRGVVFVAATGDHLVGNIKRCHHRDMLNAVDLTGLRISRMRESAFLRLS